MMSFSTTLDFALAFDALAGTLEGATFVGAALAGAFTGVLAAGLVDAELTASFVGVLAGAFTGAFTGAFAAVLATGLAFAAGVLTATLTAGLAATLFVLGAGAAGFVALVLDEGTGAFLTAVVGTFVLDFVVVVTLVFEVTLVGLAAVFLAAGAGLAFLAGIFLDGVLAFWAVFLSDMINPLKEKAYAP
jgi:hypothetical protein